MVKESPINVEDYFRLTNNDHEFSSKIEIQPNFIKSDRIKNLATTLVQLQFRTHHSTAEAFKR